MGFRQEGSGATGGVVRPQGAHSWSAEASQGPAAPEEDGE